MKPHFAVILPAAGSGKRFGGPDKLLVELAGITVLRRSVALFAGRADVSQIVLVTARERMDEYRNHIIGMAIPPVLHNAEHAAHTRAWDDLLTIVEGGRERWESVLLGLRAVRDDLTFVAIHDAARPLAPRQLIDDAFAAAVRIGGSVPCLAEPATLKRVAGDGTVMATVARAGLFQAQTPQCFQLPALRKAYEQLREAGQLDSVTDDAQVFELSGLAVAATPGSAINLKITTAEDVAVATGILSAMSPGVHRSTGNEFR